AELMVKLLREAGLTASYQVGTIALTPAQFGKWSGFVKNLNQSAQTFDVDAKAACQFLADGAIPAIVNSSSDCSTLSGNMTSLTIGHIWGSSNGKLYDPSYKSFTLYNGIDIAQRMGCGTMSSPTCGSALTTAAMVGASQSTYSGVPSITDVNEGG